MMREDIPSVMIVDDEPAMCNILRRILQKSGYMVITANDGNSAVELAQQSKPDLVIMDTMLPGIDGGKLSARIRKRVDCRIVYFTSVPSQTKKSRESYGENDALITSPVSMKKILSVVGNTLGHKLCAEQI